MIGFSRFIVSALCCATFISAAAAQEFPSRPITIVVANGPGGATDLVPRILAPEMSKALGQPVLVENRPGANNLIGFEYVAKTAPADGYTLLTVTDTNFSILPLTVKDIRITPVNDLPAVIGVARSRLVLASSPAEPWTDFNGMVAYAKANPGKLNYASSSSSTRLQTEAMNGEKGIKVVYVPYSTTGAGMQSILSRESNMGLMNEGQATPMGDKLRVLAVSGNARSPAFPNTPTFGEVGVTQVGGFTIYLNVRSGTPKAVMDKLQAAASQALKSPDVRAQIAKLELETIAQPGADADKDLAKQAKQFADIGKQIGLKPE